MFSLMLVGCGGALGAMLRYAIGLIPIRSTFPVLTLVINFLGAIAIGLIAEAASAQQLSQKSTLFWKTGVCGGFTSLYVVLSVIGCLCGVLLGKFMQHRLFG